MGRRRRFAVRAAFGALAVCLFASAAAAGDTALIDAVKRGEPTAVRALLKKGLDVNAPLPDGTTALHWAAYLDDLKTVEALLAAGANASATNDYGVAPLHLACENRNAAIVMRLLASGADPNQAALPTGVTVLMACARTGNPDTVRALLARGARVNASERAHRQTALMWAAAERRPDVVRVLIEGGADVNARSATRKVAATVGFQPTAPDSEKLKSVFELDQGGYTPLLFAARSGDAGSARLLLDAGADVNDSAPDGTSALVVATLSGQSEVAKLLLDKGADPNAAAAGYGPLHVAVLRGDAALVTALLSRGAKPDAAIVRGTPVPRYSKTFFLSGNMVGATPFFLAAQFDEPEIMRALAQHGANPLLTKPDGTTPLMAAAGVGWDDDRRERLVDPAERELAQLQDPDSRTLMESGIRAVKVAAELGGDVNATNEAGETAMHGAARHGFRTVIQFLAEKGAKLNVRNQRGQTPAMAAAGAGEKERAGLEELFRKLGAR
ncbi:MAG TPA: ankyrin repeat domain-containing protein [Caulobacterales bacterium]|nr:ankyrin repeat domain-containing protein [Caulobacterales bacterium]